MNSSKTESLPSGYWDRLKCAGISPDDSDDLRLSKSLLMLTTGLISVAIILWMALYSALGPNFSSTLPLTFQFLLAGNMFFYIKTRNFDFFRVSQLGLFLFLPFVAQWSGTIISTSGVLLWALLAPVGAILCVGVRQSIGWFIAWVTLTALSGAVDYYLADVVLMTKNPVVPVRTTLIFFALNFISVSTIIYMLLAFSIAERRRVQQSLEVAHEQIRIEQERSEKLLLNILPGNIADRLRNSDKTIADGFADVTVMFADIVNFTQLASNMSPSQVFAMLNRIFSAFDELAEQYGLEKIKTIGDAYMVAGGLNENLPDYTAAIADISIAMRDLLRHDFAINASHLEVRVGIGTGPIVAGVLGKKKFIYDLWGDTVNIASRITAEGVPGMIQCDTTTFNRLSSNFDFHEPQTIYLKGKGNMTVYRLVGRKGAASDFENE